MADSLANIYQRMIKPRRLDMNTTSILDEKPCESCNGLLWVTVAKENHPLKGELVRCKRCMPIDELRKGLRIPPQRKLLNLDQFDLKNTTPVVRKAHASVSQWASTLRPPWIFLTGPVGAGKTHLLYSACLRLAQDGWMAPVRTSGAIIGKLHLSISSDEVELEQIIEEFATQKTPLLVDEFFVRETQAALSWWERILASRYESELPTMLVSNAPPSEIKRLSMRLHSRFSDRSICTWVDMIGAGDYRQTK